jgi:hypothetical protein
MKGFSGYQAQVSRNHDATNLDLVGAGKSVLMYHLGYRH